MERLAPIAELADKEWACLERLYAYPELINRWSPVSTKDGYEWAVWVCEGDAGERLVIANCSREISGDMLSFSADLSSKALEALTTDCSGQAINGVVNDINDQIDFGLIIPVGNDLDPFKGLIADLDELYR